MTLGDLVEHWTPVGAERDLVAAKQRDTQPGFALLIKFYGRFGRFPRGRGELHPDAVEYVARALGVAASSLGSTSVISFRLTVLPARSRTHRAAQEPLGVEARMGSR